MSSRLKSGMTSVQSCASRSAFHSRTKIVVAAAKTYGKRAGKQAVIARRPLDKFSKPQISSNPLVSKLLVIAAASIVSVSPSLAADSAASFTRNCAGCHAGGGNIVQRGAGLSMQDLQKNKVASPAEIYKLIYFGKGKMPGYGIECAPKGKCTFAARIPDGEIDQLTDYVLEKASKGWAQ